MQMDHFVLFCIHFYIPTCSSKQLPIYTSNRNRVTFAFIWNISVYMMNLMKSMWFRGRQLEYIEGIDILEEVLWGVNAN